MKKYNPVILADKILNFHISPLSSNSVSIEASKINTPFGKKSIESKVFTEITNNNYIILQLSFSIEVEFFALPVEGVDNAVCGRFYKTKYTGLDLEFLLAKEEGGLFLDPEFLQPYQDSVGPTFEIYYLPICYFNINQLNPNREKMSIYLCQNEKMNIPFFSNYYGLGEQD